LTSLDLHDLTSLDLHDLTSLDLHDLTSLDFYRFVKKLTLPCTVYQLFPISVSH